MGSRCDVHARDDADGKRQSVDPPLHIPESVYSAGNSFLIRALLYMKLNTAVMMFGIKAASTISKDRPLQDESAD